MGTLQTPKTLQKAIVFFEDQDRCHEYVKAMRFPNGIACPTCGSINVAEFTATVKPRATSKNQTIGKRHIFECREKHAKRQFTLKTGSIFEDSPLPLKHWMLAMWMVTNCKNGVSSYEIARNIGITQKSAWFMLQRLRLSMQDMRTGGKLNGEVEADESFIGGRGRFMSKSRREERFGGKRGPVGKVAVMGLLQRHSADRHSTVRATVIPSTKRRVLQPEVRKHVEAGTKLFTDALSSYQGLNADYIHSVIDHAECYAIGNVHTNGMENFWSLLKRTIKGTYVSVESFHLFRYLDEQCFRFNERGTDDASRFEMVLRHVVGRRLTWNSLTAKEATA